MRRAWKAAGFVLAALARAQETPVDFARDVQPILAASCVRCHGATKSKADLRLDLRENAFANEVIVRGDAAASSLIARVTSADESERMPLDAPPLSERDVATLRAWITQGAPWPDELAGVDERTREHWAWRAPTRPTPPLADANWARNPIDAFVLARLSSSGLTPAPEADRATLLRRLSLDLNGLPPTPAELADFAADARADAYERSVERLLASPRYGERMATPWLDLARYADSHGYEKDARREMWRYRDWVIDAFNANVPYDQFSIQQLAGDLLPDAGTSQRIATGFHRNTMLNEEGGTDAEEFRVDAVLDRVNTTATVWLGATLACAQCHDHKFDPFTQRDYYRMFAAFNGTVDGGKEVAPQIAAPNAEEERLDLELARAAAELEARFAGDDEELDAAQLAWERAQLAERPRGVEWHVLTPLVASSRPRGPELVFFDDRSVFARGPNPDVVAYEVEYATPALAFNVLRLEALAHDGLPRGGPGRSDGANFVLSSLAAEVGGVALSFASAVGDVEQRNGRYRAVHSLDDDAQTGWAIGGDELGVDRTALFGVREPVELDGVKTLVLKLDHAASYARHSLGRWRVSLAFDPELARELAGPERSTWRSSGPLPIGSRADDVVWTERPEWGELDAHALTGEHCTTFVERTLIARDAQRIELWLGADDELRAWLNGALVHESRDYASVATPQRVEVELRAGENRLLLAITNAAGAYAFRCDVGVNTSDRWTARLDAALRTEPARRDDDQRAELRAHFRRFASARGAELWSELEDTRARLRALSDSIPNALVLAERESPRETRVLTLGNFLTPAEVVTPGIPALFGELDMRGEPARLALARWLVSERNPLAARVAVNRIWEQLFGRGLHATSEDFGTRSDAPSHPELLDWLACEFVASDWDVKALVRLIVSSATYRQSSHASDASLERDPDNVLLSRGARRRVEAEMLRDVALAASGLLVEKLGGRSVFPPQPPGIWNSAYSADDWKDDAGADRWRRGLYTFWKRTAPYATFALFEAPSREVNCTRRARTNTPLQALALLDDPAFVEAHVALARRVLRSEIANDDERIAFAFELCTSRKPERSELDILRELLAAARREFGAAPERASQRIASGPPDAGASLAELEVAAWTSLACVLLNLDEAQSRP